MRRDRDDGDLQEELAAHAALAAGEGVNDREVTRAMDALRDQRSLPSLEQLVADATQAIRALKRYPLFAAAAITTLTIATGANAAIFAVINSVVLQPLDYPQPSQLMYLTTRVPPLGFDEFWVSPPEYFEYQELNKTMASVGAYRAIEANIAAADGPRRVRAALVDHHLFRTLGVPAAHGRWFEQVEAEIKGPPVAVLSHELWQSAFGGRPLIGDAIDIDGTRRTVVGIMSPGADVMDQRVQIWLPLALNPADRSNRASHGLYLVGRLKSGVTEDAAQRELQWLLHNWGELTNVRGTGLAGHVFSPIGKTLPAGVAAPGHVLQMVPMKERIVGTAQRSAWLAQAAAALILIIACANLSSLLLARAESRRHEMAIRVAVGASRLRLTQLFIVEGLMLAIPSALLGAAIAYGAVPILARTYLSGFPRTAAIAVDPLVIVLTFVTAAVAGIAFGLGPVAQLKVKQLGTTMRGTDARAGISRRRLATAVLVVSQVALAAAVAVSALLLGRTVANLAAVDGGFARSHLVTFSLSVAPTAYAQAPVRLDFYERALNAIRVLPGVQSATAMSGLPLDRVLDALATDMEGYTATPDGTPEVIDFYQRVMPDYFETMGIPIVRGRGFEPADAAAPGRVAVVNETLARTFWPDQDPIGRRMRPCCGDIPWFTVVGVARDVVQQVVDRKAAPEFYFFLNQTARVAPAPSTMNFVMRTTVPADHLRPAVEGAIAKLDPALPVARLRAMDAVFDDSIQRPQLLAQLFMAFAAVALLLAAIGIYGLLSHLVAGTRKEIGIRMVMGASRAAVVFAVVRRGLMLTVIGAVVGLALATMATRWLASLLFGISPLDPTTFAVALLTVAGLGAMACLLPALAAARVAPTTVLREI